MKPNFLLIDDDRTFGKVMTKTAKSRGINLDSVTSINKLAGPECVERYDAIIVDYDLEDMTGLEIAEYARIYLPNIPIYLISGTNRLLDEPLSVLVNVVGFSTKWNEPNVILDHVLDKV